MNRFAIEEPTTVTISHVNLRDEKHGDESVPAIDIKLSMETSNGILTLFHPQLKPMLYFKSRHPAPSPKQAALELQEPSDMPNLRLPFLEPLKWDEELHGRTLTLEYGIGGKSNLKLTDCKVNDFRIEPMEGGTVTLTWRVQRSQPDEKIVGKLSSLLKRQVQATLSGPTSEDTLALPEAKADAGADDVVWPFGESVGAVNGEPIAKPAAKKVRKGKDATAAFVDAHDGAPS